MDASQAPDGPRVLVLEDEPIILMDLSFAVEGVGAKPIPARSADEALSAIDEDVPDVAVLDVNLGRGRTCQEVAERLRALGVPFVLHSGDLHRQGELIATLDAKVVPKPTPSPEVVRKALELIGRDRKP